MSKLVFLFSKWITPWKCKKEKKKERTSLSNKQNFNKCGKKKPHNFSLRLKNTKLKPYGNSLDFDEQEFSTKLLARPHRVVASFRSGILQSKDAILDFLRNAELGLGHRKATESSTANLQGT